MTNEQEKQFLQVLIGRASNKLEILYKDSEILALDKPAGMLIDAYPWYPEVGCIILGLKQQRGEGLLEYESIYAIYALEPEVSGVALIATTKESSSYLRNEFGSGKLVFRFIFLSKSKLDSDFVECDLPVAKHYTENRAVISNKTGKKCKTLFRLMETQGDYQVWEAQSTYLRMHQIRIHAMESGIAIVGDPLYAKVNEDDTCNGQSSKDLSVSADLCLHLSSVEWGEGEKKVCVHSPLPKRMKKLHEKLKMVLI